MHRHTMRRAGLAAMLVIALIVPATAAGAAGADAPGDALRDQFRSWSTADSAAVQAAQQADLEVVAEGLTFPRGLDIGADGSLYVVHAGDPEDDPAGPCVTETFDGESFEVCYTETGEVVRVLDGDQDAVVTGLPGIVAEGEGFGPSDVSVDPDGNLYMIVGLGGGEETRDAFGPAGSNLGSLFKSWPVNDGFSNPLRIADVAAFEFEHNPDEGEEPDSNPFAVVAEAGRQLVADAGGNTLLATNDGGDVTLEAVLPPSPQTVPPGLPGEGEAFDADAVPTGVVIGPDGAAYMSELPGGFAPDGSARVWRYDTEDSDLSVFADGFTAGLDLAFGPDGSLYVLQLAASTEGLEDEEAPPPAGRLVRVTPDGTRSVVAEEGLLFPTGLAIGEDGIYISNCSLCGPQEGHVVRIDLPAAEACPADEVPPAPFTDVRADSVHRPAIDCAAWWGVTLGVTPTSFQPAGHLTRAQMASFMARTIRASHAELDDDAPDAFPDDDGSVHEDNINALAAAGILLGRGDGTFGPQVIVTRDQKASMLVRAAEYVLERELATTRDWFTDDQGSVHEGNINKAADAGLTTGVTATTFNPRAAVRRDQAASFAARLLDLLVREGRAHRAA